MKSKSHVTLPFRNSQREEIKSIRPAFKHLLAMENNHQSHDILQLTTMGRKSSMELHVSFKTALTTFKAASATNRITLMRSTVRNMALLRRIHFLEYGRDIDVANIGEVEQEGRWHQRRGRILALQRSSNLLLKWQPLPPRRLHQQRRREQKKRRLHQQRRREEPTSAQCVASSIRKSGGTSYQRTLIRMKSSPCFVWKPLSKCQYTGMIQGEQLGQAKRVKPSRSIEGGRRRSAPFATGSSSI